MDQKIIPYSIGIITMSVCADKNVSIEEIEEHINLVHPTGINTRWQLSKDKYFASGETNPCNCDQNPNTRKHYLLNC